MRYIPTCIETWGGGRFPNKDDIGNGGGSGGMSPEGDSAFVGTEGFGGIGRTN